MKQSHFFAMLSRMKYINRWGLMRNTRTENLSEHSYEVAVIAHALAVIGNKRFGKRLDPGQVAAAALFHDASEIITGDMPTPIKYYNSAIKQSYKEIERAAADRLLHYLPADLKEEYESLLEPADPHVVQLVKAADKISALIKCMEEQKMGNREFDKAALSLRETVEKMDLPEVKAFMAEFAESYSLTLDEQD